MTHPDGTTMPDPGKPRLLDQVRQRCRVHHLALSTEQVYVQWIRRFILFHHKRHRWKGAQPRSASSSRT